MNSWKELQPLGCQWSPTENLPPVHLVAKRTGDWLGGLKVRTELFSLFNLGTICYQDSGIVETLNKYLAFHKLQAGTNLATHFFKTVALHDHASAAARAELGLFTFSALFAVSSELINRLPRASLVVMRQLCQLEPRHAYIMERLWLHVFGHPFVKSVVDGDLEIGGEVGQRYRLRV